MGQSAHCSMGDGAFLIDMAQYAIAQIEAQIDCKDGRLTERAVTRLAELKQQAARDAEESRRGMEELDRKIEGNRQEEQRKKELTERKRQQEEAATAARWQESGRRLDEMNRDLRNASDSMGSKQATNQLPDKNPFGRGGPEPLTKNNPFAKSHQALPDQALGCNLATQDIAGCVNVPPAVAAKNADMYLHAARVTRNKYGVYAQDQYKKAAAMYRAAGEAARAAAILREAALSDESFAAEQRAEKAQPPAEDMPCDPDVKREAEGYIAGAAAIEANDKTCAGLARAAEDYKQAAWIFFFKGIPQPTSLLTLKQGKSCAYNRSQELLARSDAFTDLIDRMERDGRCGRVATRSGRGGGGDGGDGRNACTPEKAAQNKKTFAAVKSQKDAVARRASDVPAIAPLLGPFDATLIELAGSGCPRFEEFGVTFDDDSCFNAEVEWYKRHISSSERESRRRKVNCRLPHPVKTTDVYE